VKAVERGMRIEASGSLRKVAANPAAIACRSRPWRLMSVAEALRQVLEHAAPLSSESVPLADAYGRVLAA